MAAPELVEAGSCRESPVWRRQYAQRVFSLGRTVRSDTLVPCSQVNMFSGFAR
jgi:hypothetical protein